MVRRNKNNLKLVIIDRDGTLNVFREGYIKEPEEWEPVPGALQTGGAHRPAQLYRVRPAYRRQLSLSARGL